MAFPSEKRGVASGMDTMKKSMAGSPWRREQMFAPSHVRGVLNGRAIRTVGGDVVEDYYPRITSPVEIAARLAYPNFTPAERAKYGIGPKEDGRADAQHPVRGDGRGAC